MAGRRSRVARSPQMARGRSGVESSTTSMARLCRRKPWMKRAGLDHAELGEDVGLDGWRCGGGEGEDGHAAGTVAKRGQVLADHAVVGTKVVTPLRDAVGLVDGDERGRALGEHLREAGNAKAFWGDEEEVERTLRGSQRRPGARWSGRGRSGCARRVGRARQAWQPDPPSVR